jgi:hypothetical protein
MDELVGKTDAAAGGAAVQAELGRLARLRQLATPATVPPTLPHSGRWPMH